MNQPNLGTNVVTQICVVVKDIERTVREYADLLGVAAPKPFLSGPPEQAHTLYRGQPTDALYGELSPQRGRRQPQGRLDAQDGHDEGDRHGVAIAALGAQGGGLGGSSRGRFGLADGLGDAGGGDVTVDGGEDGGGVLCGVGVAHLPTSPLICAACKASTSARYCCSFAAASEFPAAAGSASPHSGPCRSSPRA